MFEMRKLPWNAGAEGAAAARLRRQVPTEARTLENFMAIMNELSVEQLERKEEGKEKKDERY